MEGFCPNCGGGGAIGSRCSEKVCSVTAYRCIPLEYRREQDGASLQRDPVIGRQIDEYLIVSKLGEGGFGAVYLTLQLPIMMKTALKLLKNLFGPGTEHEMLLDKFQNEAQALASLSHPNIVRLIKYGSFETIPYMVMEYVDNSRNLKLEIIDRALTGTTFGLGEVRHIMSQVMRALSAAHAKQMVHRDIKPENIMLQRIEGDDLFVRVLDFGLAKFVTSSQETTMIQGTPNYMAPEQFKGKNIGPWTDVYAAGILLCELLTGRRVFSESSTHELFARKLDPDFDPLAGFEGLSLPSFVADFVRLAVNGDPVKRFRSAGEFQEAMGQMFALLQQRGVTEAFAVEMGHLVSNTELQWHKKERAGGSEHFGHAQTHLADSKFHGHTHMSPEAAAHRATTPARPGGMVPPSALSGQSGGQAPAPETPGPGKKKKALWLAGIAALLVLAGALLALLLPGLLKSPEAVEFRLNSHIDAAQDMPWVAAFADGGMVAVWQSAYQDGTPSSVYYRRFDAHGVPAGPEAKANQFAEQNQQDPCVAAFSDGRFLVVWESLQNDGDLWGTFGRLFARDGEPLGDEFQVNTHVESSQQMPRAAILNDGRFLVVWQSDQQDGSRRGIYGQLFDTDGKRNGAEFQVNSYAEHEQKMPGAAAFEAGGFVVVWESNGQDGDNYGVYGQLFDRDGSKSGPEFQANTTTAGWQRWPAVGAAADGRFVVVWTGDKQDGDGNGIFGQFYDRDGTRGGSEFQVNTFTQNNQWVPSVAAFRDGRFVATWISEGQDGPGAGVYGQVLNPDGTPIGPEMKLHTLSSSELIARSVAVLGPARFIVAWERAGEDSSAMDIYGRIMEVGK